MIKMAYDSSSMYGDQICENFDEKNNIMNPPSETGFFIYNLYGKSFDDLSDKVGMMIINSNPIRCDFEYLDLLAKELGLKKNPEWSDDEYRAYIIIHTYNTLTVKGLEYVLNQIAITETSEQNGFINVTYTSGGFKYSGKNKINQLISSQNTENDLLEDSTSEIVQIEIPAGVNHDLIDFIIQYLPYGVNIK